MITYYDKFGSDRLLATPMILKVSYIQKNKTLTMYMVINWLIRKRIHHNTYSPKWSQDAVCCLNCQAFYSDRLVCKHNLVNFLDRLNQKQLMSTCNFFSLVMD